MKTHLAILAALGILGGCTKKSSPTVTEIEMSPVEVGTKTPDYEVIAPNKLKLAPGVRVQIVKGADGQEQGFMLLKQNGGSGGFMACGCTGAKTSTCKTENDNPDHASCSGGCTDSEGNAHPCELSTIIGPPKDPYLIKFVARRRAN